MEIDFLVKLINSNSIIISPKTLYFYKVHILIYSL